jgi:hypothetical protein
MNSCYTISVNSRGGTYAWGCQFRPIIAFPRGVADSGSLADSWGVADSRGLAHPDRIATIGDTKMTLLNSLRNSLRKPLSGGDAEVDVAEPTRSDDTQADDTQVPIPDYDRLNERDLVAELSEHSQAELAAIETYEGSHKDRPAVFNKLSYLRGQEPLEGYDALTVKEILAGLKGADTETLKKTRLYERKFQHRPDVLEEVADALREQRPASVHRE